MAEVQKTTTVPESAPPSRPRTTEERKALYRALRSKMSGSRFTAVVTPGFTPYWARKNDAEELARLDALSFRIVRESDPKQPKLKANGLQQDGTYVLGDVILMEVDTDIYDFYKQDNLERAAQLANPKPGFIDSAAQQGVPAFEVDQNHKRTNK